MIEALLAASEPERARVLAALTPAERAHVQSLVDERLRLLALAGYVDNPCGFVTDVLGEDLWTRQRDILNALVAHKRVAVPASHSVSKTHTAARCAAWWTAVHMPGTALTITTAPTFRQVRNILWPHIRRLRERHRLPGETNLTEWKIGSEMVAWGFSAGDQDESAVQGVHAQNLLVIVDEAGGIGHTLGNALESITTGENTRLLLIGNPPTDEEQSWFEQACADPDYHTVRIPADDSPNLTGEDAGLCHACPDGTPPHKVATHLVDREWVDRQIRRFGVDSAFVEARVHARFPRGQADKTIPWSWVEAARDVEPEPSTDVRLGVDVAADGGDEFVVAVAEGWTVRVLHVSSGEANADQVQVAGKVAEWIDRSGAASCKIDAIGIGRGTADLLAAWQREGRFTCQVVPVNVSEKASDTKRWKNQRAEMWWTARELLAPDQQRVRLDVDDDTAAQLTGPRYSTDSAGRVVIESKESMKRRGIPSPDRAEAVLLALFTPATRKRAAVTPVSIGQENPWIPR